MKNKAGFTLIELLIALVLSIVIVGAGYATFNSQQKSFSLTNQKTDMQQQGRAAMNIIMRDIRMAGYEFQNGQISYSQGGANVTQNALVINDNNANGNTSVLPGTDDVTIAYIDPTIPYPSTLTSSGIVRRRYYISNSTNHPTLMLQTNSGVPQPLAENVDDLQIAYKDKNGNLFCTSSNSASPPSIPDLRTTRINLLARTSIPDSDFTGQRPALENHAAATATDNYRRRVLSSMIKMRNMGLTYKEE